MITPTTQVRLCAEVHALEEIFSPIGYGREVFGPSSSEMELQAEGKTLSCFLLKKILYRSLDKWIERLTPTSDRNITWYYYNCDTGERHEVA